MHTIIPLHSTVFKPPFLLFLWRWCHFSSVTFKIFFSFFYFSAVSLMCLAIDFFLFLLLGPHLSRILWTSNYKLLFFVIFAKFSATISSNIAYALFYFSFPSRSLIKHTLDLLCVLCLLPSLLYFLPSCVSVLDYRFFFSSIFCSLTHSPLCT